MTWVDFLREFGFPSLIVAALFWIILIPLRDRMIAHLVAVDKVLGALTIIPATLKRLEEDAGDGAASLKEICEGQRLAADRLAALSTMHDDRLNLVSNEVTNQVLAHLVEAALEALQMSTEAGKIDEHRAHAVERYLQEAKRALA